MTDPAHDAARRAPAELARRPVAEQAAGQVEVEQRDLDVYDRALGVA